MRLDEITRPYEHKAVDPALMTVEEYHDLVNPQRKSHPSDAYDFSMTDMNSSIYEKDRFPILLNRYRLNGQMFEIRMQKKDRYEGKYAKTDADGKYIRDENGQLVYFSKEELPAIVKSRYEHMLAVYNEQGQAVGAAQDEWGTWLFVVAKEYRGLGIGPILGKLARTLEPEKSSGGFTSYGISNFRKLHAEMVSDYLATGTYSWLIRSGQITAERVKQIVDSTRPTEHMMMHQHQKQHLVREPETGDYHADRKAWSKSWDDWKAKYDADPPPRIRKTPTASTNRKFGAI